MKKRKILTFIILTIIVSILGSFITIFADNDEVGINLVYGKYDKAVSSKDFAWYVTNFNTQYATDNISNIIESTLGKKLNVSGGGVMKADTDAYADNISVGLNSLCVYHGAGNTGESTYTVQSIIDFSFNEEEQLTVNYYDANGTETHVPATVDNGLGSLDVAIGYISGSLRQEEGASNPKGRVAYFFQQSKAALGITSVPTNANFDNNSTENKIQIIAKGNKVASYKKITETGKKAKIIKQDNESIIVGPYILDMGEEGEVENITLTIDGNKKEAKNSYGWSNDYTANNWKVISTDKIPNNQEIYLKIPTSEVGNYNKLEITFNQLKVMAFEARMFLLRHNKSGVSGAQNIAVIAFVPHEYNGSVTCPLDSTPGKLTVKKYGIKGDKLEDDEEQKPLAGMEFRVMAVDKEKWANTYWVKQEGTEITYVDATVNGEQKNDISQVTPFTTNSQGEATIENLDSTKYWYKVIETKAPTTEDGTYEMLYNYGGIDRKITTALGDCAFLGNETDQGYHKFDNGTCMYDVSSGATVIGYNRLKNEDGKLNVLKYGMDGKKVKGVMQFKVQYIDKNKNKYWLKGDNGNYNFDNPVTDFKNGDIYEAKDGEKTFEKLSKDYYYKIWEVTPPTGYKMITGDNNERKGTFNNVTCAWIGNSNDPGYAKKLGEDGFYDVSVYNEVRGYNKVEILGALIVRKTIEGISVPLEMGFKIQVKEKNGTNTGWYSLKENGKYDIIYDEDKATTFRTVDEGEAIVNFDDNFIDNYLIKVWEVDPPKGFKIEEQEGTKVGGRLDLSTYTNISDRNIENWIILNKEDYVKVEATNNKKIYIEGYAWLDGGKGGNENNLREASEGISGVFVKLIDIDGNYLGSGMSGVDGKYTINNPIELSQLNDCYIEFNYGNIPNNEKTLIIVPYDSEQIWGSRASENPKKGIAKTERLMSLYEKFFEFDKKSTLQYVNIGLREFKEPEATICEDLKYVKVIENGQENYYSSNGDYTFLYEYGVKTGNDNENAKNLMFKKQIEKNQVGNGYADIKPINCEYNKQRLLGFESSDPGEYRRRICPGEIYRYASTGDGLKIYAVYELIVSNQTLEKTDNHFEMYLEVTSLIHEKIGYKKAVTDTHEYDKELGEKYFGEWNEDGSLKFSFKLNAGCSRVFYIEYEVPHNGLISLANNDNLKLGSKAIAYGTHHWYYKDYLRCCTGIHAIIDDGYYEDRMYYHINPRYSVACRYEWAPGPPAHKVHINWTWELHRIPKLTAWYAEDAAPGFNLHKDDISGDRKIEGYVFKDSVLNAGESIQGLGTVLNGEIIGNGKRDNGEKGIEKVKIDLLLDKEGTKKALRYTKEDQSGTDKAIDSASNGYFALTGIVPGEYYIRYTYSDGTTVISNETFTIDDYKSTIVTSQKAKDVLKDDVYNDNNKEWYKYLEGTQYSIALDNLTERAKYNTEGIDNKSYQDKNKKVISAKSAKIKVTIENDTVDKANSAETMYHKPNFDGFNFGLVRQPEQRLEINKAITGIQIETAQGSNAIPLVNPAGPSISHLVNLQSGKYDGSLYVRAEMEEDSIYGSTITLTYTIYATNKSDINYYETDDRYKGYYYKYGEHSSSWSHLVEIDVEEFLDCYHQDMTPIIPENEPDGKKTVELTREEIFNNTNRVGDNSSERTSNHQVVINKKRELSILAQEQKINAEESPEKPIKYNKVLALTGTGNVRRGDKVSRTVTVNKRLTPDEELYFLNIAGISRSRVNVATNETRNAALESLKYVRPIIEESVPYIQPDRNFSTDYDTEAPNGIGTVNRKLQVSEVVRATVIPPTGSDVIFISMMATGASIAILSSIAIVILLIKRKREMDS